MDNPMITLVKGISSGTTALIHRGVLPAETSAREILDPVRGIGADLLVTTGAVVRAYTMTGEITPPAAALRLAAALASSDDERGSIEMEVDGGAVAVGIDGGEYAINHGPWSISGGAPAIAAGHDRLVSLAGVEGTRPGLGVDVGEYLVAVVALGSSEELGLLDLSEAPAQTAAEGQPGALAADTVCALTILGERSVDLTDDAGGVVGSQTIGAVQVRAYDSGTGEVYSGDEVAVAAAAAARTWLGEASANEWIVVFGAGNARVMLGEHAVVAASAEIFASIEFTPAD